MRRLLLVLVLLSLYCGALPAAAQTNQDFSIEVEAGYDGLFHTQSPLPVVVTVANDGADFSGLLEVRFRQSERSTITQEIELPRGSRKRVALWLQGEDFGGEMVEVRLTVDGQAVAAAEQRVTPIDPSVVLVAYVTDGPADPLPDLTAPVNGPANVARLAPADLPDLDGLLLALDMIVLGSGELTPAQVGALQRWVVSGGTLLIDGGPAAQIDQQLSELLPATPGRVIEGAALGQPDIERARRLTPLDGALSWPDATSPLWVERSLGAGVVRLSAVALNQLPAQRQQRGFWRFDRAADHLQEPWMFELTQLRTSLPGLALPQVSSLALFLLVYILFIGPINYLLLRRLDRREWAWFTIPAGVLIFTGAAYLLGFGLRSGQPILINVAVVQSAPGETSGRAIGNVGFAAVRRGSYTLNVEGSAIGWWPIHEFHSRPRGAEDIRQGVERFSAVDLQANVGEIRHVMAVAAVELPFQLESEVREDGTLAVTNTGSNAVERVYLLQNEQYVSLGTLSAGETREVDPRRLNCCFPHAIPADESSLVERTVFGVNNMRFGFQPLPPPVSDNWTLMVLSDSVAIPAALDRQADTMAATIYLLYVPTRGEP